MPAAKKPRPRKTAVSGHLIEEFSPHYAETGQPTYTMRKAMKIWFRISPEITGITSAIADDIVGEGYDLLGEDANKKRAQEFIERVQFDSRSYAMIMDSLITGDGYLGISRVTDQMIQEAVKLALSTDGYFIKNRTRMKLRLLKQLSDKINLQEPRDIYNLSSTITSIRYDSHGTILGYVQSAAPPYKVVTSTTNLSTAGDQVMPGAPLPSPSESVEFAPEEVLHYPYMRIGDSVYGYTPFEACLNNVASSWYMLNYVGEWFQRKGALADQVILLKNDYPNSPTYKDVKEQIQAGKSKRGVWLFTGDMEFINVNKFGRELELPALVSKFIELTIMAWNIPATRAGFSGLSATARYNIEANEGYYKKINRAQQELEQLFNFHIFRYFDVIFRYKRAYKRDESREADIVNKLVGKPVLTVNEGRDMLGKEPVAGQDIIPEQAVGFNPSGFNTPRPRMTETQQLDNPVPDVPEELPPKDRLERVEKTIHDLKIEKKSFMLTWENFKRIVEAFTKDLPNAKIFYSENDSEFKLWFGDGQFVYTTAVLKAGMDLEAFRLELRNAIPVVLEKPSIDLND